MPTGGGEEPLDFPGGEILPAAYHPVRATPGRNFPIYGSWGLARPARQFNDLDHAPVYLFPNNVHYRESRVLPLASAVFQ
jgi:hypothetical protein